LSLEYQVIDKVQKPGNFEWWVVLTTNTWFQKGSSLQRFGAVAVTTFTPLQVIWTFALKSLNAQDMEGW
jgi:hypothetical protein